MRLTFGLQYCISLRFESWNYCFLEKATPWRCELRSSLGQMLHWNIRFFSTALFLCILWWKYCFIAGSLRANMIHGSLMLEQTQRGGGKTHVTDRLFSTHTRTLFLSLTADWTDRPHLLERMRTHTHTRACTHTQWNHRPNGAPWQVLAIQP